MLFLINILSRQWIHNERMNFPLLKVPEMIGQAVSEGNTGSFFLNRFLLAGLCHPGFSPSDQWAKSLLSIDSINSDSLSGRAIFFPEWLIHRFSKTENLSLSVFYRFCLFDITANFLFFLVLLSGRRSPVRHPQSAGLFHPCFELGVTFGPTLARPEEMQMIGAYGVFFLFLVWLARLHLFDVCKQSLFLSKPSPGRSEWFDVRISFWGAITGFALIIWWYIRLGMAPITAVLIVGAFFMIMLVATRIICQGGLAYFTLTAAPTDGMIALFGTKLFAGVSGLLAGMSQKVLFVDLRESLLPSLLHARQLQQNKSPGLLLFSGLA